MIRRLFLACAFVLAACQQIPPPPPAPTPTPIPKLWDAGTSFGVQSHVRTVDDKQFAAIVAGHFEVVRFSFVLWWTSPTGKPPYNWTQYDAIYAWATKNHITPIFQVQQPATVADSAELPPFLQQAATRYPLAWFELGNEPNNATFWPNFYPPVTKQPLTATAYWALVEPWAIALRAGNANVRIASGGTSGVDLGWQAELVGAGAWKRLNGFAIHPYSSQLTPPSGDQNTYVVSDMIKLKATLPPAMEVWVTEYGLADPNPSDIDGWFAMSNALGWRAFVWYEMQDNCVGAPCPPGAISTFGLIHSDYSPKPAYTEFAKLLQ